MAKSSWCTKFVFACIPMRYLPSKSLRAKANSAITKVIAWDCHYLRLGYIFVLPFAGFVGQPFIGTPVVFAG